ncbi:AAA family ATPase [Panacibacter sp. DH6]|uniref:AAA family ATPase n=1 Tax=Panacibacter microcysteis TaxID=2793269 RepID=A0A931GYW7_9BACT|nr:AAA family ATPase [Panacibacter microcysteis]MBG9377897.1 AAA family ATPase [Panacibacter microcysteis]
MRIALTGAHRVGKTSLAESLQQELVTYDLTAEPYHQLEEAGYAFAETPGTDDFLEQLSYAFRQIRKSRGNTIFDRCPIDLLAYIYALDPSKDIRSLYAQVETAMQAIDLLVFVPIEKPDLNVCSEPDLPLLRAQVNDILESWISDFNITMIAVNGSLANRTQQVLNAVF